MLGVIKLLPQSIFRAPSWLMNWLFSAKNTELLKEIVNDADPYFVKWAVEKLLTWKNSESVGRVIKIHGTADRLIPIKNINCIKV